MIKEYNNKRNYKTYTLYKKSNPFVGYEQTFQKMINEEIKQVKNKIIENEQILPADECKIRLNHPDNKNVKVYGELAFKNISADNKDVEMFYAKKYSKMIYLYKHLIKCENKVFLQSQIESLAPNDKKGKQEILKTLVKEFANVFDKYIKDVVVEKKPSTAPTAKKEETDNKFMTLSWHAFAFLQDMKIEKAKENTITVKHQDIFKNNPKRFNKYQKIYYSKQAMIPVFEKVIQKLDTINAYVLSKQHKDSDKTQLLLETHGTNLECDYVVSYKEFEPAAPKPKKVVEPKEKKPRAKKEKRHE